MEKSRIIHKWLKTWLRRIKNCKHYSNQSVPQRGLKTKNAVFTSHWFDDRPPRPHERQRSLYADPEQPGGISRDRSDPVRRTSGSAEGTDDHRRDARSRWEWRQSCWAGTRPGPCHKWLWSDDRLQNESKAIKIQRPTHYKKPNT